MSDQKNDHITDSERDITLRDLILVFKEYVSTIIRNWLLILLIAIPLVGYVLYRYYTQPTVYSAKFTFMINQDEGNSVSSIGSILGQIGIGGAGGRSRFNLDKILQLSQSRNIIAEALFDSCDVNGKNDLLANHFIDVYGLDNEWKENFPDMSEYRFVHSEQPRFSIQENRMLKRLVGLIRGPEDAEVGGLIKNFYSETSSIMTLSASTINPDLTYHVLHRLFENLSEYYIDKTTEKQKVTYELVLAKKDSIEAALRATEFALANFRETNRGILDSRLRLQEARLNRDVIVGTQAYAEAVKNVEISDFALKNQTPFIQPVDEPIKPIMSAKVSLNTTVLKGALVGILIGILFVILRKIYRDTMSYIDE